MAPFIDSTTSSREGSVEIRKPAQKYLTNCKSLYSCIYCRTHLANHDELVSRSFRGNHGRAYLFNSVINVSCGPAVQRELITGSHAVADIFCENCEKTLGWKYEKAYIESQKYKEGKFIIELAHVVRENKHLELDRGEVFFSMKSRQCDQKRCSLEPPSPAHWLSLTSSSSEDVDELMFPFYDDLYSDRSSYRSNLSSSQHTRMRRSLYLDSTPYDWKYSTTSSSPSSTDNHQSVPKTLASSLGSYDLSPPSTSSSSDSSLEQHRQESAYQHHIKSSNCNNNSISDECKSAENDVIDKGDGCEETQFNFEPDLSTRRSNERPDYSASSFNKVLGQLSSANKIVNINFSKITNIDQQSIVNEIGDVISNVSNSVDLEDEEFYDCCTDHDVSNSDSSSTLY